MATNHVAEFAAVGAKIEGEWRKAGLHPRAFPEIASKAAADLGPVDVDDLLLQESARLDQSYRFSDFDLHIFATDRFRIEILYWVGNSTSIHQHAFSGAFKLLQGRSLHAVYDFAVRETLHPEVLLGDLHLRHSEIMVPGDVRTIEGGRSFIHANYHMVRPTVTMVIRTLGEWSLGPQLTYRAPNFAVYPFGREMRRNREQRLVEVVARSGQWKLLERVFDQLWLKPTIEEALEMLELPVIMVDDARRERALQRACETHPQLATELMTLVAEDRRRDRAKDLRAKLKKNDQKFLFALLINLREKSAIMRHLAEEFPDEAPAASAARLLAAVGTAGHLPKVSKKTMPELIAVLEGRAAAKDVRALRPLIAEDALRPLWAPS